MFSNADLVVQGKIVSDTAYEANGWVYTSYIIEQCAIQKDGNGSRGKTLAITKIGGLLNNVDYYSPHGVDISGGEEAVFFLNYMPDDEITPSEFTSVLPICNQAGFAKYLTEGWKPVVAVGNTTFTAADFRSEMQEYAEFEYCRSFTSQYVAVPSLVFADGKPQAEIKLGYESHTQLPPQSMTLELTFENPVAHSVLDDATFTLIEAVDFSSSVEDSFTLSVTYQVDSFTYYLNSTATLGTITYSNDQIASIGRVEVLPIYGTSNANRSDLDRVVFEEEDPGKEGFKRATITSVSAEVVAGIRRAVSLSGFISTQKLGIVSIEGSNFGNYSQSDLADKVPREIRIKMLRESDNPTQGTTISPMAGDIITWQDNLIEFYAPTLGYIDYPRGTAPERAGAFSGRISVETPGSSDRASTSTKVYFNQRANLSVSRQNSFDDNCLRKQAFTNDLNLESSQRGLAFVVDPSFVNALVFSSDLSDAKDDLCDAAAEWTEAIGIPIEIFETCPTGIRCFNITGGILPRRPDQLTNESLAQGSSAASLDCDQQSDQPRVIFAELLFNTFADDPDTGPKFLSRQLAGNFTQAVVYDVALHEFGHILQQLHVDDPNELMFPSTYGASDVTDAAVACGIHVRNVGGSVSDMCSNIISADFIPKSCGTSPTKENENNVNGINMFYDFNSANLVVSIASSSYEDSVLSVADATGRIVFTSTCTFGENRFSLNSIPKGFYGAILQGADFQIAKSFISN